MTARERANMLFAKGTKVPRDVSAEVPERLDAGEHTGVTGARLACMCLVLVPVTQSGSSTVRQGGAGNVGGAARMDH
jgi:hypothetical protein